MSLYDSNLKENERKESVFNKQLRFTLKSHFDAVSLSSEQKQALEATLLSHPVSSSLSLNESILNSFISPNRGRISFYKKIIFSHLVTAVVAIAVTLGFATYFHSANEITPAHDLISDVVNLSENLNFPADFDLDGGTLNDLPDLIHESLPNHSFSPAIPVQLAQDFSAHEGRFFLYKGEQGVGISMLPMAQNNNSTLPLRLHQGFERSQPSTLYIVKLSEKNRAAFPTQKVSRKISSASGKVKRVYAWSDGAYGYAMVQPLELGE